MRYKNATNVDRKNPLIENVHGISPENNENGTTNERTGSIVACISPDNRTPKRTGLPKNHTLLPIDSKHCECYKTTNASIVTKNCKFKIGNSMMDSPLNV